MPPRTAVPVSEKPFPWLGRTGVAQFNPQKTHFADALSLAVMPGPLLARTRVFPSSKVALPAPQPLFYIDYSPPPPRTKSRTKASRAPGCRQFFAMDSLKRHSLAAMGKGKDKEHRRPSMSPTPSHKSANTIDLVVESPPAVFYGNANQSTGALYAGQLRLTVVGPEIRLTSFTMRLDAVVTTKKPVAKDCRDCTTQTTELKQWTFLSHSKSYAAGSHSIPFSYLIPGHLPATTIGEIARLQYFLVANAVTEPSTQTTAQPSASNVITMRHELPIQRAVKPLDEKVSLRIFPPTNLAARVTHSPVIHPIGEFNIQMQVSGIKSMQKDVQTRWRLRKLHWRLEETEKMVSPACSRHTAKVGGEGRGIGHEDTRTVGRDELKSGWKTDLSEGTIELEFVARPGASPLPLCDVESPNGLSITHSLVIELIIAEEWAPIKNLERGTPTGAARVLRMQFNVMVTQRSGMGIAWDEEMPPMYEDVPASPPMYPADKGPPSYPEGVAEPETREMQRVRSEIVNYTGTPLGSPLAFEEEEEGFEGLSLGPSRLGPARAGPSSSNAAPGSSRTISENVNPRPPSSGSAARALSKLTIDDFETDEPNAEQN